MGVRAKWRERCILRQRELDLVLPVKLAVIEKSKSAGSIRRLRFCQVFAVVFVAAVAFIQSWTHIYGIARPNGEDHLDAALLPLSVDGMIVACSLTMWLRATEGKSVPLVTRLMLYAAVFATCAANIIYGLPWGPVGIGAALWPAIAFLGTVEGVFGGITASQRKLWHRDEEAAVTTETVEPPAQPQPEQLTIKPVIPSPTPRPVPATTSAAKPRSRTAAPRSSRRQSRRDVSAAVTEDVLAGL